MNTLGITVSSFASKKYPPFHEIKYFHQLSNEGKKKRIQIFIFDPLKIDWRTKTVTGWILKTQKGFEKVVQPIPKLIYDRIFYRNRQHFLQYKPYVTRLMNDPTIRFLGRPLKGKYQTYQLLRQSSSLEPYLPETVRYDSMETIQRMLHKYNIICLKPNGGSHGRGVIKITQQNDAYFITGRNQKNAHFSIQIPNERQFDAWIQRFVNQIRYIIQPYLTLVTPDGFPFDVRILVQKNEQFSWTTTGAAVRVGHSHSITSNLHGGGKAIPFHPFIEKHYTNQVEKIQNGIKKINTYLPTFIEQHHGPLVELGIDIGIDREANIWILEVNSKPGRSVFLQMGKPNIHQLAVQLPIRYAEALLYGARRWNPVIQNSHV